MAQTASEIVVAGGGSVHVAPVGTSAPTDPTSAYAAGWKEIGYTTEAGVKLHDAKTMVEIKAWQAFYPVRRIISARDFTVTFALQQWDYYTVPLAFGGGTITTPSAGVFKYAPPAAGDIDNRALGIDWNDGSTHFRLVIPNGVVQDAVDTELTRTKESDLPIVFGVTISDGGVPYTILTDASAVGAS